MTEQEWLSCADPQKMWEFLRGKASERKARLFAVACCRNLCHLLAEPLRKVVEVGERYADRHASEGEANEAAGLAINQGGETNHLAMAAWDTVALCSEPDDPFNIGSDSANEANAVLDGRLAQCHLLRCIFGNIFHAVSFDPSWRTLQVVALAQAIYENRTFDRLPALADALEQAGCDNADILAHCRGPGPHVKGCWALDLVLGKE
jgi:hypothetical protein